MGKNSRLDSKKERAKGNTVKNASDLQIPGSLTSCSLQQLHCWGGGLGGKETTFPLVHRRQNCRSAILKVFLFFFLFFIFCVFLNTTETVIKVWVQFKGRGKWVSGQLYELLTGTLALYLPLTSCAEQYKRQHPEMEYRCSHFQCRC